MDHKGKSDPIDGYLGPQYLSSPRYTVFCLELSSTRCLMAHFYYDVAISSFCLCSRLFLLISFYIVMTLSKTRSKRVETMGHFQSSDLLNKF